MNDPHVVALCYNIKHSPSVSYEKATPRDYEEDKFSIHIADGEVRFTMKAHYATAEEAKQAVREYIRRWEFDAGLKRGPGTFELVYHKPQIVDRQPSPPPPVPPDVVRGRATLTGGLSGSIVATGRVTEPYPPPPPPGLKIIPDVQSMYDRLMRYRLGREQLPGMAYFCLTMLEKSAGVLRQRRRAVRRQAVAERYRVEKAVLDKIGDLSSEKGGPDARKANGTSRPLEQSETRFLKKAMVKLIYRAAEIEHGSNQSYEEIRLSDLWP